jgi:hypothetical protein
MNPEAALSPFRQNDLDSIDLSLQLENSLDIESSPPSSPHANSRPPSLDASVLASIITQLRLSLAETTKERDDFLLMFEDAKRKQTALEDNLQVVTDKSALLEEQLSAAREKHKEDEDAISMLRAKVEESRYVDFRDLLFTRDLTTFTGVVLCDYKLRVGGHLS